MKTGIGVVLGLAAMSKGMPLEQAKAEKNSPRKKELSNYENGSCESKFFSLKTSPDESRRKNLETVLSLKREINIEEMAGNNQVLYLGETHDDTESKKVIKKMVAVLASKGYTHFAFETLAQNSQGKFIDKTHSKFGKDSTVVFDGYDLENPKRHELFLNEMGQCWTDPKFYGEIADEVVKYGMEIVGIANTYQYSKGMGRHDQMADKLKRIFDRHPEAKVVVLAGKNHVFYDTLEDDSDGKNLSLATFPGIISHYYSQVKQSSVYFMEKGFMSECQREEFMAKIPDQLDGKKLSKAEKGFDYIVNVHIG